jgi:two-component system, OmpR family, response regulator CpxR
MNQQRSTPAAQVNPTVLLVEDDLDVSEAIAELLSDAGYQVVCAGDGRAALQLLLSGPTPAALVLDLFLPTMNGWALFAELSEHPVLSRIPVIVVTAAGEHWGYPVRPSMVVRKPVDSDRLLGLVRAVTRTGQCPRAADS